MPGRGPVDYRLRKGADMIDVLVIEDDEFKATDILRLVREVIDDAMVNRAASVTSALRAITSGKFDLVIMDMSLPTFDLSGPGGGGSPQGQGGVEILRLARRLGTLSPFVVVTQYPDIDINGDNVPLEQAAKRLSDRFGLCVQACLPYEFDSDDWQDDFRASLERVRAKARAGN